MLQPARSKAGGRPRPLPPLLLPLLLALLPLSCASVNGSSAAPASSATAPLAPFHSVVSCLPFSLLIRPSSAPAAAANTSRVAESDGGSAAGGGTAPATTPSPAYTLRLDASDANITGAFEYSVSPDGTLHLSLSTPIATNSCASAIVELPADALREVRATMAARFGSGSDGYLVTQLTPFTGDTDNPAVVIEGSPSPFNLPSLKAALYYEGQERIALNGSALVVTPNASLSIEGTAGPLVIASAGICNLRLPSDNAWVPSQPCRITGEPPLAQAGGGAAAFAQRAGPFTQTCHFDRDANTTDGTDVCHANVNTTQFDQLSGLDGAAAAVQPPPGPLAEESLQQLLDHAHQLAPLAAAGDAEAAANLTGEAGQRADPDLLVLLSEIAFSEGGHAGALAACEEVNWGCVTRYGCRNSFQRALALLINHNDTAGIRNALETGAEWGEAMRWCVADFGGVRTPNATALMLAAGLTLAGGYFREAAAAAAVSPYVCKDGLAEGCKQVRGALAEATVLAPRLGYGSSQEVMSNMMAVSDLGWRACIFATAGNAECRANVNATQFDQLSSLDSAAAAVQPLPGPLAEEALQQLLDRAHQLAPLAAVGDAAAAANLTGEAGRRNDPDLLVLLSVGGNWNSELNEWCTFLAVRHWYLASSPTKPGTLHSCFSQEIAFSEGGHAGALAACEEVNWGCSTRFGCRNSFQRALALLINHNDTAGIRNALEMGAEWERSDPQNQGKLSTPPSGWWAPCGANARAARWAHLSVRYCVADFGGVRTPNATALMLAAGLTLAGGYFREAAAAAAAAPYVCKQGPEEGCKQVRRALAEAVMLAPRLRYGSSREVISSAMVSDPGWRACLLAEAPPPMPEGWAVGCST
ncbi:hypothetical protein COHA_007980 [Chlorella ohadii]|uniref:Uncharacterized protein n=1 Tax=Chlorella ohadii TaxID=2649997 RepID=A0AAD5H222_9CHLO|nr:hypothetical protein COHA_007980 [Chlorella ohadii]